MRLADRRARLRGHRPLVLGSASRFCCFLISWAPSC
jgi:hypothetical protein